MFTFHLRLLSVVRFVLQKGDVVECQIDEIGAIRNTVV